MGCDGGHYYNPGPCANCGKPRGGVIGYSDYGYVCSKACGIRLDARMNNGMIYPKEDDYSEAARIVALRLRIKYLESLIRRPR